MSKTQLPIAWAELKKSLSVNQQTMSSFLPTDQKQPGSSPPLASVKLSHFTRKGFSLGLWLAKAAFGQAHRNAKEKHLT